MGLSTGKAIGEVVVGGLNGSLWRRQILISSSSPGPHPGGKEGLRRDGVAAALFLSLIYRYPPTLFQVLQCTCWFLGSLALA